MLSVTSLVRALFRPTTPRRPAAARASLAVESLEGRALLSSTPVLPSLHHGGGAEVQHRRPEHKPQIQIEHAKVVTAAQARVDDHGANRRNDGVNDKNDDRRVKVAQQAQPNDDRGANRRNDGVNDKNDDRGGHR